MEEEKFWVSVLAQDVLSPGEMTAIQQGERRIAIYNLDGKLYATDDICTHALAYLTDGWIEDGEIVCPLHEGRFDIRTGRGLCAPITCDIRTYPVRIENGNVEILVEKSLGAVPG
jgi:nitrite reductase/ring-hydroxylating ferredoxin subunit